VSRRAGSAYSGSVYLGYAVLFDILARLDRLEALLRERRDRSRRRAHSIRSAAAQLGIDRDRLARWVKQGLVRTVALGEGRTLYRVPEEEVQRLLREGAPDIAPGTNHSATPAKVSKAMSERAAKRAADLPPIDEF
jgi:excisionase family DNA binding protein